MPAVLNTNAASLYASKNLQSAQSKMAQSVAPFIWTANYPRKGRCCRPRNFQFVDNSNQWCKPGYP